MLPKHEDLVLKDKVLLYNNLAKINDHEGRLLAELQVYPSVRLTFEFEILGEPSHNLPHIFSQKDSINVIVGQFFSTKNIIISSLQDSFGPRHALNGTAAECTYGDIDFPAHRFKFYLPNCRVQRESGGQVDLDKKIEEANTGKEMFRGSGDGGRYVEISLDATWSIRLNIEKDAMDWLEPKKQNIGTLITTSGELYQPGYDATEPEKLLQLEEIKTEEALKHINHLSLLLSFANGGFVDPLYIESSRFYLDSYPVRTQSAYVQACKITPIENLGVTWVTRDSDLKIYLSCLNSFALMQQQQYWRDTFCFVLIQYFQAVQYHNTYWPIQASSLAAALERLSYTLLVEEEANIQLKSDHELLFDMTKMNQVKTRWQNLLTYKKRDGKSLSRVGIRLSLLLEKIGLISDINADDIQIFLDIRNDAVHPKQGTISQCKRNEVLGRAMMWVDEILLWRLGYDGKYLDRSQSYRTSISPRFDLTKRDPSW